MTTIKNIIIDGKHQRPILADLFYHQNQQKKPVVIFAHGFKGFKDWGAWNLVAHHFADHNLAFVKFNFSHNGGTAQQPIDFQDLEAFGNNNFTKELDDLQSLINWILKNNSLKKEFDFNNISLIGHSRGGGIALLKAAKESSINKIITWASVSDFGARFPSGEALEMWRRNGVSYINNSRTHQKMPLYFQFYQDFEKHKNLLNISSAVKNLKIPQLIINGTADETVKYSEAENIHKWNPNSELYIIENANHTFGATQPWTANLMPSDLNKAVMKTIDFINNN